MPILYLSFTALALYGLYHIPSSIREVIFTFAGFFIVCVVAGFVWQVLRTFFGRGNTSPDPTLMQKFHLSGDQQAQDASPETPQPPKRDKASIQNDVHDLQLFEDDFLR